MFDNLEYLAFAFFDRGLHDQPEFADSLPQKYGSHKDLAYASKVNLFILAYIETRSFLAILLSSLNQSLHIKTKK